MPDKEKNNKMSWPEIRKMLHESMKRTSDYAGAIIRLGVLSVLIAFLFDRINNFGLSKNYYFISLILLTSILSIAWISLAVKIFIYTFANLAIMIVPREIVEEPFFEVNRKLKFTKRIELSIRNSLRVWKIVFLGGAIISVAMLASIAAFHELAAFVDRPRP